VRRLLVLLVGLAPELLDACVAATAEAVVLVADRILLVVVLVVVLGRPERAGRDDLRDDRLAELLFVPRLGRFGRRLFDRIPIEDRRAVLRAVVAELRVRGQRIDVVP